MAKTGEVSSLDDAVGAIPNPVFSHHSFPFILSDGSFPGLDELYHSHAPIRTLLNADHQCSHRLSFSAPCFAGGLQGLCFHQTPDSIFSSQGVCWALPPSFLPALWPGISLEAVPQMVFLGLSCMSLISWASWKPLFYVPSPLQLLFLASSERVNVITPSWSGAEVVNAALTLVALPFRSPVL